MGAEARPGAELGLGLAQVEVAIADAEGGPVGELVAEIERRYAGRGDMLVDYPVGEQSTLAEAIENLTTRKWRG